MTPFPTNSETLAELSKEVGEKLLQHKMRLVTAESCTGGYVAQMMTCMPGSSHSFERGFVTYSNTSKQEMLGVRPATLEQFGAVSEQTAREMAQGALLHSPTDISVAITGIAGPGGESDEKPIGTVWIAWATRGPQCYSECFHFEGDREAIRRQTVFAALKGLISILSLKSPELMPPVITLDGPSGTGKGTLSKQIAQKLGWHYLDSGSTFRVLAHAALQKNIALSDESALQTLMEQLNFKFTDPTRGDSQILLDEVDITDQIRTEECGAAASRIAVLPLVREALLQRQRRFRQWPGLVTDGRDMGTVIFPDAILKIFLYASPSERAKRRFEQLKQKGMNAIFSEILRDMEARDKRDQERDLAPLKPAADSVWIDTTDMTVVVALDTVMQLIRKRALIS